MLIRGGRIIDPSAGLDQIGDLLIEGNNIVSVRPVAAPVPEGMEILDAFGSVVCPGFVDLHTHLRFPGFPEKETIVSGTAAAAAGGFTTVCAMANTSPVVDRVEVLDAVYEEVVRSARVHVRQIAAVSMGLQGRTLTDMRALAGAGAVAFSDDGKPVESGELMEMALHRAADLGLCISVHEEDPAIVRGGVANAGEPAASLGLRPWPCAGEAGLVARDLALLRRTGGRLHIAHVSCADTVAVLERAIAEGLPVTAEVTPHHLRLTDSLLAGDPDRGIVPGHPCTKVNPPLRAPEDVQSMIDALASGTIGAVATDHAPHTSSDKAGSFSDAAFGISAIETALPLLLDLVRAGCISLPVLIERLTSGPAAMFGLSAGTLRPGAPADICIFDPKERWTLRPESMYSKGKNTPLIGAELQGRVRYTFVNGALAHRA
jgi:dihydroorotase